MLRIKTGQTIVFLLSHGLLAARLFAVPLVGTSFSGGSGAVIHDLSITTGQAGVARTLGIDRLVGVAASADGTVYGLTGHSAAVNPASLYQIDTQTGTATLIGPTGLSSLVEGDLAIDPIDGKLYGSYTLINNQRFLFTIDPSSGATTLLPNQFYGDCSGMAFDATGTLYMLDTSLRRVLKMNKQTGATVSTANLNVIIGSQAGMARDPISGTFYVVDGGTGATGILYTLEPTSGTLTVVGATGAANGLAGLAFLPEPTSLLLFLLMAPFFWQRRRGR